MLCNVPFLTADDPVRRFFLQYEVPCADAVVAESPEIERIYAQKVVTIQAVADRLLQELSQAETDSDACKALMKDFASITVDIQLFYKHTQPQFRFWLLGWLYQLLYGRARTVAMAFLQTRVDKVCRNVDVAATGYLCRCLERADKVQASGDLIKATSLYRSFCALVPDNKQWIFLERLGDCCLALGNEQEALDAYEKMRAHTVNPLRLGLKYANSLLTAHRAEEAASVLKTTCLPVRATVGYEVQKDIWAKLIEAELQKREYIEATNVCFQAIKEFPEENQFKLKLIESYLYSDGEGSAFCENFELLHTYFSEQNCYPQFAKKPQDSFSILFDFIEYVAKRTSKGGKLMHDLLTGQFRAQAQQFLPQLLKQRIESLWESIENLKKECDALSREIQRADIANRDEQIRLENAVAKLNGHINGHSKADIPIGLFAYVRLCDELAGSYNFPLLGTQFSALKEAIRSLMQSISSDSPKVGLSQELRKRIMQVSSSDKQDDVLAVDLIRMGNLMNYLQKLFTIESDNITDFFASKGISTSSLFSSKIMEQVPTEVISAQESPTHKLFEKLQEFFQRNSINSLESLKTYVNNIQNQRALITNAL